MNCALCIKNCALSLVHSQIVFQDNRSGDLIHQSLVLTSLLLQATLQHRLMGQHRGKPLVEELDGHLGNSLSPTIDKLLHTRHVLTGLTVRLPGLTDDDSFHRLLGQIGLQPVKEFRRRNSRQPSGNNLQRVGDCQSCTLLAVVDGKNPRQLTT